MYRKKHPIIILLLSLFILLTTACSSRYGDTDLSKRQVLTMSNPQLTIKRSTPLTWYSNLALHSATHASDEAGKMLSYIQKRISDTLVNKGFNLMEQPPTSRYQLVAVAMLGNNPANQKILELFKLFPGLAEKEHYQQGTLLVAIVDVNRKKAAWRGSVQMFVDPSLPRALRLERINGAVTRLLQHLKPHA
ncbi:hypothetical protein [Thalassomonas actiniarum]|uniref:DUF4136 domain-containing protein n=1 Tax=Thalassomonas actiniarum TaxID=485447 RepID=A0AAF0C512_9GAMM|nr:hypothetical protein [Thalassomonas actiniarum]WDE01048.1 hypothetical protein SG35_010665 [Thalassomonas actiniarum]